MGKRNRKEKLLLLVTSQIWLTSVLYATPLRAEVGIPEQPPVADFSGSPTSGYAPLIVYFTDLSTSSPDSWAWNFGNGKTSTEQHPATIYSTDGFYSVSQTVGNYFGSDNLLQPDYIDARPCPFQPVRIDANYSTSIQTAYDNVVAIQTIGDPVTVPIEIQGTNFVENLILDNSQLVAVLEGGRNCEYTDSISGGTTINGSLLITAGAAAVVENLVIR